MQCSKSPVHQYNKYEPIQIPEFTGEIHWPCPCNRYARGTTVTAGSVLVSNSSESAQPELGTCSACSRTSAHITTQQKHRGSAIVSLLHEQGNKRYINGFQDGHAGVFFWGNIWGKYTQTKSNVKNRE